MHVLLTNDDGPLNDQASPYVKFLVDAIEKYTDWDLSIVVPNTQRSWIGKAHFAGKDLTASFIYPTNEGNVYHGPFPQPQPQLAKVSKEWCLLDGTPASCSDIGIHHLYKEKGPVDLVISGPNFGRNSTALYITSSGTIGAAMEASLTGVKAIGLSYAFENRQVDFDVTSEAAKISVKLITHLYNNWPEGVDLYSINIPLIKSLKLNETKISYAPILPNKWGSIFTKEDEPSASKTLSNEDIIDFSSNEQIQFKWKPDFRAVHKSVLESQERNEHNDGIVLLNGGISVTPLKAIFKDVPLTGEITLEDSDGVVSLTIDQSSYIYPAIVKGIETNLPGVHITNVKPTKHNSKVFQYGEYEDLDFDRIQSDQSYLVNSYIYRKALIRKHYLAHTIHTYVVKTPDSILKTAFPETFNLEVDYAEFLQDSLDEAYDLRTEIENGGKTWILKPSMSDRGQGIRIFRTIDQLQDIFDSFEEDDTDEEGEENYTASNHGIITSQLRHFVVQEYLETPLLLPDYDNRKFHIRTYVVANGSIQVYVFKKMLALFAVTPYTNPSEDITEISMFGHLTNTCLQGEALASQNASVVEFWELKGLSLGAKNKVFNQLKDVVAQVFKAAINVDRLNFQPLSNAFEIFGFDFLVDSDLNVSLLEINSFPDFKQTGDDLKRLIYELFDSVIGTCVNPFFAKPPKNSELLVQVLNQDTNGNWR